MARTEDERKAVEANIDRYDKEREASKAAHPAGGSR